MKKTPADFPVLFSKVHNRGSAPVDFLTVLVDTIRDLPEEVFSPEYGSITEPDVYEYLGLSIDTVPRAVMCEILRVLGGFESSWRWNEGRDATNTDSSGITGEEAGVFQCSANSMNFHLSLKACLARAASGNIAPTSFITTSKQNHPFAIEYCARLLRFTARHHGPLLRMEIVPWLDSECIAAFQELLIRSTTTLTDPMPATKLPYMIDPGHGGVDSGASGTLNGQTHYEKNIVFGVGTELATLLGRDGRFSVWLTRTGDSFPSLTQRSALANANRATLVSIHANAGGGTGFECFTSPGQTKSDALATALLTEYGRDFGAALVGRYDKSDGDPDKEARFAVLVNTQGPAALFELGFMDRESDLRLMTYPYFAKTAAAALYRGILAYEGLAPPVTEPPVDPGTTPLEPTPLPVDPVPVPVEALAGAFRDGYEAAITQLIIRRDSMDSKMVPVTADFPDLARAYISAQDAREYLSHPAVRKAAGLPV